MDENCSTKKWTTANTLTAVGMLIALAASTLGVYTTLAAEQTRNSTRIQSMKERQDEDRKDIKENINDIQRDVEAVKKDVNDIKLGIRELSVILKESKNK